MKTIETYLPVFSGFYGSWFETEAENQSMSLCEHYQDEYSEDIPYDDIEFDYKQFYEDCAEGIYFEIHDELVSRDLVKKMDFERIVSPKYYNFENDSIYVTIHLADKNVSAIMNYLNKYREDFKEYIEEKYSSRSGFISRYSNDVQDWLCEECLEHSHKLGSILEFILTNDGYDESYLFYNMMESYQPRLEATNIDELVNIVESGGYDYDED